MAWEHMRMSRAEGTVNIVSTYHVSQQQRCCSNGEVKVGFFMDFPWPWYTYLLGIWEWITWFVCYTVRKNLTSKTFSFIDGNLQDHDVCDSSIQKMTRVMMVGKWLAIIYTAWHCRLNERYLNESQSYCGLVLDQQNDQYHIQCLRSTQPGKS